MPVVPSIGTRLGSGWGNFLKGVELEGERVADLLADQVRFRLMRPGSTSLDHVVPDSARARELWQQPATRQFVQGVLELANEVGTDAPKLRGFTLATSEAGYVINRATHHMRRGGPTRDAYDGAIEAASRHTAGTVALRKGSWLHLGPRRSMGLLHALEHPGTPRSELSPRMRTALGRGVKTLLHELDHVGTPTAPGHGHLDWLREGRAEAFARWPGRVPAAGEALGIDVPRGVGKWAGDDGPYKEEVAAVRALLRMSGIDTTQAAGFAAARELLGHTPEHRLSAAIADAVAARHGVDAAHARELRSRVRTMVDSTIAPDGSNADPREVRRLSRSLEAARRERVAARASD